MKKTIIVLSAAALVCVATAVAQGAAGKTPGVQHHVSGKHPPGVLRHAPPREMQAVHSKMGYPATFGYAPGAPSSVDRDLEASRQAGGGGGGGAGM
jgi:hypothetical protein